MTLCHWLSLEIDVAQIMEVYQAGKLRKDV